jgi:hypothetical protein
MRTSLLVALALLALPAAALAQNRPDDDVVVELERPVRGLAGGHLYYARAVGDFSDYIDHGWGGDLHATLFLDDAGILGLRFDASYLNYGRERVNDVCALPTNCRVLVDVITTNNMAFFGAGPQLMAPSGPIRPYLTGQVGWTFIWTNSSIEDNDRNDDFDGEHTFDTDNASDNTFSYGGMAGILIPLGMADASPVSLDIGARYLRNGRVRYLREGDIVDNVSGPPTLNLQRSRADLMTVYVGVSVGLR